MPPNAIVEDMDMDALPLALAEPPSGANLRTNSAGIQLCLLQEQDPRGNAGHRIGVRSAVGDWRSVVGVRRLRVGLCDVNRQCGSVSGHIFASLRAK